MMRWNLFLVSMIFLAFGSVGVFAIVSYFGLPSWVIIVVNLWMGLWLGFTVKSLNQTPDKVLISRHD